MGYDFMDIVNMPYMLKELLYQGILYEYSSINEDNNNNVINLDEANPSDVERILGGFKHE